MTTGGDGESQEEVLPCSARLVIMKKALVLLVVGVAVGYWWGFTDARTYHADVVTRLVQRVGGRTRSALGTNTDHLLDSLERH